MITQTTANLADAAYFALKNKILRGELKSGFPLREEQLSESLGVSRTPLRKALTQLLAEGFLVKGKDRTLRIPYISTSELKDTLKARRLIETAAVAEACNRATEKDIIGLLDECGYPRTFDLGRKRGIENARQSDDIVH